MLTYCDHDLPFLPPFLDHFGPLTSLKVFHWLSISGMIFSRLRKSLSLGSPKFQILEFWVTFKPKKLDDMWWLSSNSDRTFCWNGGKIVWMIMEGGLVNFPYWRRCAGVFVMDNLTDLTLAISRNLSQVCYHFQNTFDWSISFTIGCVRPMVSNRWILDLFKYQSCNGHVAQLKALDFSVASFFC